MYFDTYGPFEVNKTVRAPRVTLSDYAGNAYLSKMFCICCIPK